MGYTVKILTKCSNHIELARGITSKNDVNEALDQAVDLLISKGYWNKIILSSKKFTDMFSVECIPHF